MTVKMLICLIIGYCALKLINWLVKQEHSGDYIDIHLNFWGDISYITYKNKRYYPEFLERGFKRFGKR